MCFFVTYFSSHLFGPQPVHAIVSNTSYHQYARTNNDVPGFFKLIRDGSCASCNLNKAAADVSFYRDLRDRFRLQSVVDAFRARHFSGKTVVGMHIRAGNGERGDFKIRGRGIGNMTKWLDSLTDQLLAAAKNQKWGDAVLFLATDTPSVIDNVRKLLSKENELMAVDVVSVDQFRPAEGSGVLFGVQGKIERQNELCLQGWENTIMDMMLLSHADVLIAARPSSFTQSLPMQIVLATDEANRVVAHPYCEVNPDATEMRCYSDFADWCCRGRTVFSLQGIQRYDYLRMPHPSTSTLDIADSETRRRLKIRNRPDGGCIPLPAGRKQICLPYDWSEVVVKARTPKTSPPPLSPLRAGRIRNRKERRTKNEEDTRNEEVKSNSILISEYRILELPPPVIFVALQGTDNLSP